ncbi:MAG: Rieske 2Fe-2S domain-containing protein [Actinomycetota bacterium]|nr:Rieske 2Fe-2S domain-containing protein [Actinomycetota bacterium]
MTATDRSSPQDARGVLVWYRAVAAEEFWEGDILDVEVGGEQVLLVSAIGEPIRAFQGICPHQEILLVDGSWDEDRGTLVCAGHAWEFDLQRGIGINPAGCALYEFPVRIAADAIEVGVPQDGERHYRRCNGA